MPDDATGMTANGGSATSGPTSVSSNDFGGKSEYSQANSLATRPAASASPKVNKNKRGSFLSQDTNKNIGRSLMNPRLSFLLLGRKYHH